MRRTLILASALCLPLAAHAQMGAGAPPAPAVGSAVAPADAYQRLLGLFEHDVVPAAKAMPADKYDFAPSQAIFAGSQHTEFATVRTFRQQVLHLAQANYFFYSSLTSIKPDTDVKAIGDLKTKDEAVAALEKSFAYAHRVIAALDPATMFVAIKPVDGQTTRATVAAFAVAHGYDHYGQLVEYLRMNGIVPPSSAK